ncbi:MAG: PAS domain-containing protein [Candidatus Didemnitutus sp.]|nr:PAS domain-containing protein [Candidatus Didemnitutus sp.]
MFRSLPMTFSSFRGRLLLLGAVVAAASLILGTALTWRAYLHERAAIARDLQNTSRAVATLIDQELKAHERFVGSLATADALYRDDFAAFYERAARIASGDARWIVLLDETGRQLVNTRLPFGAPLPGSEIPPATLEAWRAGRSYISNVIPGTAAPGYVLAITVPHMRHGKFRYAVALALTPQAFVEGIDLRQIAPGYIMSVLDRTGTIVWRNRAGEQFIGRKATPDIVQAVRQRTPYLAPSRTLEGIDVLSAVSHGADTGWATVIGAPVALLEASAKQLLRLGLAITLGILALTILVAWRIGRDTVADVNALVTDADKFARGMLPPPRTWAFAETATVAQALRRTLTQLHAELHHRTQAEATLRLLEQRFRLAANADQLTFFEQDAELRYTWLYPEHGAHRHAIGQRDTELASDADATPLVRLKREVLATGEPRQGEVSVPLATGLRHYSLFVTPRRDPTTGCIVGVAGAAVDITDRKNAEQALEHAQLDLRRANAELESKVRERTESLHDLVKQMEEFTYSVSHDLRAPIRAITGFSGLLLEDHAHRLDADAQGILQRIIRSGERLDRLISDLLAFSRIARHDVELAPVDAVRILRDLVNDHPALQPPAAEIALPDSLPPVLAHDALLQQVLSNLLTNAAKFVPPGRTPRIDVSGETRAEHLRIWVRDNGIGIRPDLQPRLFRIFERLHSEAYEGTGIGLATARRALERLGGSIGVESDGVNGSRFWIELPLAPSNAAAADAPARA